MDNYSSGAIRIDSKGRRYLTKKMKLHFVDLANKKNKNVSWSAFAKNHKISRTNLFFWMKGKRLGNHVRKKYINEKSLIKISKYVDRCQVKQKSITKKKLKKTMQKEIEQTYGLLNQKQFSRRTFYRYKKTIETL